MRTGTPAGRDGRREALAALPLLLAAIVLAGAASAQDAAPAGEKKPSLKDALAALKIPPDWMAPLDARYDTNKPWKEARIEIRKRLGSGDATKIREAVKLTYLYSQKNDIGDGHELPMYLYMGGEHAWAIREYEKRIAALPKGGAHECDCLAACYRHFGEYDKAAAALANALQRLPDPPWNVSAEANIHSYLGDTHAAAGKLDLARQHYKKAMELYPTSKQPWGQHLLPRHVKRIQGKLDSLAYDSLKTQALKDGTYSGAALGYKEDVQVNVTIQDGKIADIKVQHKEDIEQNATKIVPERIVAKQSLRVDAVTGSTVTSNAIIAGTLEALRKAGLK